MARYPVLAPVRMGAQLARAVWAELDDPFTPVLVVGATASALLGSAVDAYLVIGAVGLNAFVGGVQRLRAQRALFALVTEQRRMARWLEPSTGEVSVVEAARLSRGEMIELHVNDVVPADARLLEVDGCEVDESSLTGESLPTPKHVAAVPGASLADRSSMVFEGTTVVAGYARAVVVGTGHQTEAGRAASLAARVPVSAGVQARLHRLTRRVLPFTLAGGAAVAGLALLRGRPDAQGTSGRAGRRGRGRTRGHAPGGDRRADGRRTAPQPARCPRPYAAQPGGAGPRQRRLLRQDRDPHGEQAAGRQRRHRSR